MAIGFFRRRVRTLLLVLAAAAPWGASWAYGDWVLFGDSLSDTGNNAILLGIDAGQVIVDNSYVPTYPYASGRYSNGEVWTASFAAALGLPAQASLAGGHIYAHGGARTRVPSPDGTPSLLAQLDSFLAATGGVADPGALYVVAGGGNNARDTLDALAGGAPILRTVLGDAVRYAIDVGTIVDRLQAAGAQDILVWNTPNIALAPAVRAEGDVAVRIAGVVVKRMNQALDRRLTDEDGVRIFDSYAVFSDIVAHPGDLVNVTDACGAVVGCDPATSLFWDGIHPTSAGHARIAGAMIAAVVPEPGAFWLLAAGLGVVLLRQRRPPR